MINSVDIWLSGGAKISNENLYDNPKIQFFLKEVKIIFFLYLLKICLLKICN